MGFFKRFFHTSANDFAIYDNAGVKLAMILLLQVKILGKAFNTVSR
jgi:hypothetical protein